MTKHIPVVDTSLRRSMPALPVRGPKHKKKYPRPATGTAFLCVFCGKWMGATTTEIARHTTRDYTPVACWK